MVRECFFASIEDDWSSSLGASIKRLKPLSGNVLLSGSLEPVVLAPLYYTNDPHNNYVLQSALWAMLTHNSCYIIVANLHIAFKIPQWSSIGSELTSFAGSSDASTVYFDEIFIHKFVSLTEEFPASI